MDTYTHIPELSFKTKSFKSDRELDLMEDENCASCNHIIFKESSWKSLFNSLKGFYRD